jgi:hypothetical protein
VAIHSAISRPAPPLLAMPDELKPAWRFAQDEIAVGREAFRPVEQHLDLRRLQARRAVDGGGHQRLELVPVLVEQLELEVRGDRVHAPGLGLRLEAAHQ